MANERLVRSLVIGQTGAENRGDEMSSAARVLLLAAIAVAASACSREAEDNAGANAVAAATNGAANRVDPAAPAAEPALAVVAERGGLRLGEGEGRELRFGTAQAETLARLAPLGQPPIRTTADCGAGPIQVGQWPNGLTLLFQEGRFVGWTVDGPAGSRIRTRRGIGTGSTRAELEAAHQGARVDESTLGTEFDAEGIGGLLESDAADAKITSLWAGTTCHFR
jgi:hypothetical protein